VSSLGAMCGAPPAPSPAKCRPGDPLPSAARCERARPQGEPATLEGPTGDTKRGGTSGVCEQDVLCAPTGHAKRTGRGSDLLRERRGLNRFSPRFLLLSASRPRQSTSPAPGGVSASSSQVDHLVGGSHPTEGRTANSTPAAAGEGTKQHRSERGAGQRAVRRDSSTTPPRTRALDARRCAAPTARGSEAPRHADFLRADH